MTWLHPVVLSCQQQHCWDLLTSWPLPERGGQLICPRCATVLVVPVPTQPEEVEYRAYPGLLRKILLFFLLSVLVFSAVAWPSFNRWRIDACIDSRGGPTVVMSTPSAQGGVVLCKQRTKERTEVSSAYALPALSPDGRTLALAASEYERQPRPGEQHRRVIGIIQLWDIEPLGMRAVLRGHESMITALAFSPDGRFLFSADKGNAIKRWETASGRGEGGCQVEIAGNNLAFSPDERTLAIGTHQGRVALLDTSTWEMLPPLQTVVASSPISALAFTADGKTLATAGAFDRQVKLWNPTAGVEVATIPVECGWLTCLAFAPDGRTLAVGTGSFGRKGEVKLFDMPSGRERLSVAVNSNTVTTVTFSSDGETVVAGSSFPISILAWPRHGEVHRWAARSGRPLPH